MQYTSHSHQQSHCGYRFRHKTALLLLIGLLPGSALATNALKDVSYSVLPGNKVQFRLTLAEPAPAPENFITDAPARLVLTFPEVALELQNRNINVGVGAAHSVNAVEAGSRARVVFNLNQKVPYTLRVKGNTVLVNLDSQANEPAAPVPAAPPVQALAPRIKSANKPERPAKLKVAVPQNTPAAAAPKTGKGIQAIDFHKGKQGQGQVVITLDRADTPIDLKEEGKEVVLDIASRLPPELYQKLDVVDFSTPVQSIQSEAKDDHAKVRILASGEYEFMAYQAERVYTVEFRTLTLEEKEQQKKQKKSYNGERLSLNFQSIDVRTVLHLLGDFTEKNMVISDTVTGKITLRLKNVPWDQAMDLILKTKFLDKREQDTVIYVAPSAELAAQEQAQLAAARKIEELAPLHSEFIRLNYADAADIASVLQSGGSSTTTVQRDAGERISAPQQSSATKEVSHTGASSLLSARGNVTVHKQTNSLLIQDTADKLEEIRAIIAKVDIPVRQVLIESRIVIANNDFAKDLGVRFGWSGARSIADGNEVNVAGGLYRDRSGNGNYGLLTGTGSTNKGTWLADTYGNRFNAGMATAGSENLMVDLPVTSPSGAVNFLIGKIGSYLLQLELSAMQSEGNGEVISSPRVVTSNQVSALIEQGVEIPYQQSSSNGGTTVAFKKAVLALDVKPLITADDRISMELDVKKDIPDWSRVVLGVPPVDTRHIKTTVLVDNGETVVLGGVFERNKTNKKDSVPFFGEIPIMGNLFKRTSKVDSNTELLIFITPKLLKQALGTTK